VHEVPGLFNLLLLVWTPGKRSPIHDHADAHCLMKVLKGSLIEKRFQIPKGPTRGEMRETCRKEFGEGKVTYIADSMGLHEISNPSGEDMAVSLHRKLNSQEREGLEVGTNI
jgi:cysteine dioxygenase